MKIRYAHTNIISRDWKRLADFYTTVFDCVPVPPQRDQQGDWLDKATGVTNAHLIGMHLLLPGHGANGPTLEIFQYTEIINAEKPVANKQGFGHIAFELENIVDILALAIDNGAEKLGELSEHFVAGVGHLTVIYISDPEGNIIELQHWERP